MDEPKKRGRPKKAVDLSDGQTMRGPSEATRKIYKKGQPQAFMDEIIASGKYVPVVNEETGQGVFVGLFNPRSSKTESGRDVALVLFEIFRADESDCCKAPTKRDRVTKEHTCKDCGQPCTIHFSWVRKPTHVPNPRTGGMMNLWNQCTVAWSQIAGTIDGMAELSGLGLAHKIDEVRASKEVKEDKMLMELKRYAT
jgi:hypothetical protein